jgi:hypothetical protein
MNSDTKGRLIGLVGLTCFAVWVTFTVGRGFYLGVASSWWPTTTARVTASAVDTGVSNIGRWWQADVDYEYQVNGKAYSSDRVRFLMPPFYREEDARDIQTAFPQGAQVKATYNPKNPSQSILQPGIPPGMWIRALLPLFFWSLIGYIYYEIRRPGRRLMLLPDAEPAGQE